MITRLVVESGLFVFNNILPLKDRGWVFVRRTLWCFSCHTFHLVPLSFSQDPMLFYANFQPPLSMPTSCTLQVLLPHFPCPAANDHTLYTLVTCSPKHVPNPLISRPLLKRWSLPGMLYSRSGKLNFGPRSIVCLCRFVVGRIITSVWLRAAKTYKHLVNKYV